MFLFRSKHKIRAILFCSLITGFVFFIFSSYRGVSGNSSALGDIHDVTDDFSFIKRFICISDLLGEEQWSKQNGRSFDKNGVALTQGKKHPVNICHYALFCFDEYRETGDEKYKESFLNNAKVLLDSGFYHRTDYDKIAYPYFIKFHDLKPPWYSALAQSEAISVLIRYYSLTKEPDVLTTIIELKNFMIAPQEGNCGTMNITPEGHEWYEEYPNSNQEKQVLNGFFLAIVALHEYCNLFPNDTATYRLYLNSIETAKQSFQFYDTGSWLKYNRGDKRQVNAGYMKWQTLELKFLYQLTGDETFRHLMMLVATYCYNKPYVTPGSKLQDYDFSVPMSKKSTEKIYFEGKRSVIDLREEQPVVEVNCSIKPNEVMRMYDNNINSYAHLCKDDTTGPLEGTHDIIINFKTKKTIGSLQLQYIGLDALDKPGAVIYYKDTTSKINKFRSINVTDTVKEPRYYNYFFNTIQATAIKVQIEKKKIKNQDFIRLSEVSVSTPPELVDSDFQHYTTEGLKGEGGEMLFSFKSKNMKSTFIFYREADSMNMLSRSLYKYFDVVDSNSIRITTNENKVYQFLVVSESKNKEAYISDLSFNKD